MSTNTTPDAARSAKRKRTIHLPKELDEQLERVARSWTYARSQRFTVSDVVEAFVAGGLRIVEGELQHIDDAGHGRKDWPTWP